MEKTIEQLLEENTKLAEEVEELKRGCTDHTSEIENLKTESEKLKVENDILKEEVEELKRGCTDHTSEIENLKTESEKLKVENDTLKEEVETVTAVNDELQLKIEELSTKAPEQVIAKSTESKPVLPSHTFEVDEETYRFISPVFIFKQQRFTAEAALQDEKLQAQLVDAKSGCIVKV